MAPTTLEGCRSRLGEVRAEVARIEPEYVRVSRPQTLFEGATPNPAAARALGPALTRLMKGEDGRPVDYTLECRGWVCRMLVLQSSGNPNAWQLPLQRDPELLERTRLRGFGSGRPTRDPASGTGLRERQVWLKLAALDGGRLPGSTMGRIPTRIWTEPANPAECQSALGSGAGAAGVDARGHRARHATGPALRYRDRRSRADPSEFRNLVKAAVAGTPGIREPQVECRPGRVCRISAKTEPGVPADVWWHRITRDPSDPPDGRQRDVRPRSVPAPVPSGHERRAGSAQAAGRRLAGLLGARPVRTSPLRRRRIADQLQRARNWNHQSAWRDRQDLSPPPTWGAPWPTVRSPAAP